MFLRHLSITQPRPFCKALVLSPRQGLSFIKVAWHQRSDVAWIFGEMYGWGMDGVGMVWVVVGVVTCYRCDVFDSQTVCDRFLFGEFLCWWVGGKWRGGEMKSEC